MYNDGKHTNRELRAVILYVVAAFSLELQADVLSIQHGEGVETQHCVNYSEGVVTQYCVKSSEGVETQHCANYSDGVETTPFKYSEGVMTQPHVKWKVCYGGWLFVSNHEWSYQEERLYSHES